MNKYRRRERLDYSFDFRPVLLGACAGAVIGLVVLWIANRQLVDDQDLSHLTNTFAQSGPARGLPATDSQGNGKYLICIDPGHPSETSSGAEAHGLSELRLNWEVAERLAVVLKSRGIGTVLTKETEEELVTNRRRAEIANLYRANLLVRLHCDTGAGRGYTCYYPDRAAEIDGVVGPPLDVRRQSKAAAIAMNSGMKDVLEGFLMHNPIRTDAATLVGSRQGGVLTGSVFTKVPTVLVEMCFINQQDDASFIASQVGQERMASALAKGIAKYLEAAHSTNPDSHIRGRSAG